MGIVWEAYHKGVPLLGGPGITLDPKVGSTGIVQVPLRKDVEARQIRAHLSMRQGNGCMYVVFGKAGGMNVTMNHGA